MYTGSNSWYRLLLRTPCAPSPPPYTPPPPPPPPPPTEYSECQFVFSACSGGVCSSQFALSEMRLYNKAGSQLTLASATDDSSDKVHYGIGGCELRSAGLYSGCSGSSNYLIDGSTGSKACCGHSGSDTTVVITLALATASPDVGAYQLTTSNDSPSRDPVAWTFSCRGDTTGASWELFSTRTSSQYSDPGRASNYPMVSF